MAYRWVIAIFLALLSAALMAGPRLGDFLIWLAVLLLLGFGLREIEKTKRLKSEKRDNE
nr:hypothetical protein [Sphingomonas sp.]